MTGLLPVIVATALTAVAMAGLTIFWVLRGEQWWLHRSYHWRRLRERWRWRAPSKDDPRREAGSADHRRSGLRRWQQLVILGICAALVAGTSAYLLSARSPLSALRPGRGGSHTASEVSLTSSFREGYEQMLANQKGSPMRLKRLRCVPEAGGPYLCEALTQISGSGAYPAQFKLSLSGRHCWQARPLEPNVIK